MSRLIVITGIPASGKSTVARILAQRSRYGVMVDGDVIVGGVVSGGVHMSPNADDEALRQLRLRYRAALAVAEVYLGGGFDVVFGENILGPVLAELPALVPCDEFHLVVLNPAAEMVLRRDRSGTRPLTRRTAASPSTRCTACSPRKRRDSDSGSTPPIRPLRRPRTPCSPGWTERGCARLPGPPGQAGPLSPPRPRDHGRDGLRRRRLCAVLRLSAR